MFPPSHHFFFSSISPLLISSLGFFSHGVQADIEGTQGSAEGSSYVLQCWYCILFLFLSILLLCLGWDRMILVLILLRIFCLVCVENVLAIAWLVELGCSLFFFFKKKNIVFWSLSLCYGWDLILLMGSYEFCWNKHISFEMKWHRQLIVTACSFLESLTGILFLKRHSVFSECPCKLVLFFARPVFCLWFILSGCVFFSI